MEQPRHATPRHQAFTLHPQDTADSRQPGRAYHRVVLSYSRPTPLHSTPLNYFETRRRYATLLLDRRMMNTCFLLWYNNLASSLVQSPTTNDNTITCGEQQAAGRQYSRHSLTKQDKTFRWTTTNHKSQIVQSTCTCTLLDLESRI
jgi:hypothetical protein